MASIPDPSHEGQRHSVPRPGQPTGATSRAPVPLTPGEDRRWAYMAHSFSLVGFLPSLIIYLIYRDRGPFTAQESREGFNFTLPLTVAVVVCLGLGFIPEIGWVFALLAVILWLFMTISGVVAGVQVNKGRPYLYRLNLRLFLY